MLFSYKGTDRERFSLHDCRAVSAELVEDRLIFVFPGGIFCADYGKDWPNTGAAAVEFALDPQRGSRVYLFRESGEETVRECLALETLTGKLNAGEWELEFLFRYDGYGEILYICYIWGLREPGCFEAHLSLGVKDAPVFRWDPPETRR